VRSRIDDDEVRSRVFGPDPLDEAARELEPGGVSEKIEVGGQAYWIRLIEIVQPEGRSLYDAQTEIERRLRDQRMQEEEIRYFSQLFRRGSFTEMEAMMRRLLEFAAERYLIQARIADRTGDPGE